MRTHTLVTRAASIAVCFGMMLSAPAATFGNESGGTARDVELSADGTLHGHIYGADGRGAESTQVELRFRNAAVARANTGENGQFTVTGVRPGVHDIAVGSMVTPVRLWKHGTAPEGALSQARLSAKDFVVRGQDPFNPTSGFGLLDVVTVTTLAAAGVSAGFAIDNANKIDDLEDEIKDLASP